MFATSLQLDSISLPAWADAILRNTRQTAAYTHVILKAFNKTIAPQIASTTKGLSHYYIQCGQGAGERVMSRFGITHNPVQAAVRAAHVELVSPKAIATYRRIRSITHEIAMTALIVGLCGVVAVSVGVDVAQAGYRAAVKLYRTIYRRFNPSEPIPELLPSVGMAIASTEIAEALADFAAVAEADIQAKAEGEVEAIAIQSAEAVDLPAPEPVLEQKPEPEAMDELAAALDVPGAIAKPKPKGSASKVKADTKAAAQPKEARAKAGARGGK
jgi:hypothetical protein